jgi:hypothetical protein
MFGVQTLRGTQRTEYVDKQNGRNNPVYLLPEKELGLNSEESRKSQL